MIYPENAPDKPGCYLFKDAKEHVIYVGKAKNLKKRVKSYFQKTCHDAKTNLMIKSAADLDFIATDTEVEALILENRLIKKHQPKYNIDLKDSKSYAYLQITDEDYPRLLLSRRKTGSGRFFGPFVSAQERETVSYFVKKTFKIRTCKRLPKKPCLRFHIKLCQAPCAGHVSKEEYNAGIELAKKMLSGGTKEMIRSLKQDMQKYSDQQNFEAALDTRKQISALEKLAEKQDIDRKRKGDEDIINYVVIEDQAYMLLFNIYKGTLEHKKEYIFSYAPDFLEEFIVQYYSDNPIPNEIIMPEKADPSLKGFLEHRRGSTVRITVPIRGEKRRLLDLVKRNVEITFLGDQSKLVWLQDALGLQTPPRVIECFDVSHLSGTSTVGSMVQFRNAKPDKNNYRRFKIKTVEGIDDTAAISEIMRRRYNRLREEGGELPDLIVIDGGAGQLNAAMNVLKEADLDIPVISIAKRFEAIYVPGTLMPLVLDRKNQGLKVVQEIRDEAHRFAIKYQRLLREKEMVG